MIFFVDCNLRRKCLHSSFYAKVEAEQGGRGRREGRAGEKRKPFLLTLVPTFLRNLCGNACYAGYVCYDDLFTFEFSLF